MAIIFATYYINILLSSKDHFTKREKSCHTPFYEMEVGLWSFISRRATQMKVRVKRKPFKRFHDNRKSIPQHFQNSLRKNDYKVQVDIIFLIN